jgi:hypothetical protein
MIDLNIFKRFTSAAVLAAVPSQIPTLPTNPYYPLNLSLPAYAANELSLTDILARFAAVLIVLFTCTQYAAHALNQNLSWSSRATIFWFVLCRLCPSPPGSSPGLMLGDWLGDFELRNATGSWVSASIL